MSKKKEKVENKATTNETNGQTVSQNTAEAKAENGKKTTTETVDAKCEETIESIRGEMNEYKDKYLRLSAEFDNYRKRTQREKMDLIKYASEDVIKGLLPVVDDFERAIKSTMTSTDIEAVKHGLSLIHIKFLDFLRSNGIQEIMAVGQNLNTDHHEAITKFPVDDEAQKGKIVDVVEKGYMLNEKVIRFSKVVVGE
jgi:molecular chaperone GrpE